MTILLGSNNTTGFTSTSRMAGLAGRSNFQPYVCSTGGVVTSLAYYWGDTGVGSENLVIFLCNSTGGLLCTTNELTTPSATTQFVTGSVTSSVSVTSGQTYYIGLLAALGNNGGDNRLGAAGNGLGSYDDTTTVFTYPTPASQYSSISLNAGLPNWLGYADGTTVAVVPYRRPPHYIFS